MNSTGAQARDGEPPRPASPRREAAASATARPSAAPSRRLPIGAEPLPGGGVHFRVWAPAVISVAVERLDDAGGISGITALQPEAGGYFSGIVADAQPGTRYRFRLPQGSFPDPASRFQPDGPHGPSEVVDPDFPWSDDEWRGRPAAELVLYELHLGTFTTAGTWSATMAELPELARLGITALEIMPIAEFPGTFGWGYDGVDLFAPTRLYGRPEDARRFVARAHELGLMVILDVVYNHFGPDGCYLREFAPQYFSTKYQCEWGDPLNFEGDHAKPVREFFLANARYWIDEFHFDGLRLDATQQIFDASPVSILAEIPAAVRAAAPHRQTFVVGENEPQHARLARPPARQGFGFDAVWNDDFHHSAIAAAVGKREAYYLDYRGAPQEFVSAAKYGFLFQGQWNQWQQKRRGTPALDLAPARFVTFLQNHDQIANSLRGLRLHQLTSPAIHRALTALLLLSPSIPMLFQGQEFGASTPFLYFAEHHPALASLVAGGRRRFLEQFRTIAAADAAGSLAEPHAPETFRRSQLNLQERETHRPTYLLHQDLLRLRREDPVVRDPRGLDGAVLGARAFLLRYFAADGRDRLLLVNLGGDLTLRAAPEPLLAPVDNLGWEVAWSSENPAYGGLGTPALETTAGWIIPGPGVYLLSPHPNCEPARAKLSEED